MQSGVIDVKVRTVRNAIKIQFDLICYVYQTLLIDDINDINEINE